VPQGHVLHFLQLLPPLPLAEVLPFPLVFHLKLCLIRKDSLSLSSLLDISRAGSPRLRFRPRRRRRRRRRRRGGRKRMKFLSLLWEGERRCSQGKKRKIGLPFPLRPLSGPPAAPWWAARRGARRAGRQSARRGEGRGRGPFGGKESLQKR